MTNPFMELIGSGEGDYNDYNRGTIKDEKGRETILPATEVVDFSSMTIKEIQRRQALPITDTKRMLAVGRYQMVTKTLAEVVTKAGVDTEEFFTPELQDRLLNDHFLRVKRRQIGKYIEGDPDTSLHAAQKATCREWASVEDPDNPGHVYAKYEEDGNRMHTRAEDVKKVLDEMRNHYQAKILEGVSPDEAWRLTINMGPGQHVQVARSSASQASGGPLKHGSRGEAVLEHQRHLQSLGYRTADDRELKVDGHFGDDTKEATQAFQRAHGLEADGVAGKRTLAAIAEAMSTPPMDRSVASYLHEAPSRVDAPYLAAKEPAAPLPPYQDFAEPAIPVLPSVPAAVRDAAAPAERAVAEVEHRLDEPGVRKLQEDLNALGITNHHGDPLGVSGEYNDETRMAVMGFQMDLHLPATGMPDVATVALADARASIARMQELRDIPVLAERQELDRQVDVPPGPAVDPTYPARAQASSTMPFSDPGHPQHGLYADLRERLPEEVSEMRVAQFTAACHKGGIGPGELEAIQIVDDRAVFVGGVAGYAEVDMRQTPSIEQSAQQVQAFDQQQAMDMNQRAQELQQAQGMSMSM